VATARGERLRVLIQAQLHPPQIAVEQAGLDLVASPHPLDDLEVKVNPVTARTLALHIAHGAAESLYSPVWCRLGLRRIDPASPDTPSGRKAVGR